MNAVVLRLLTNCLSMSGLERWMLRRHSLRGFLYYIFNCSHHGRFRLAWRCLRILFFGWFTNSLYRKIFCGAVDWHCCRCLGTSFLSWYPFQDRNRFGNLAGYYCTRFTTGWS